MPIVNKPMSSLSKTMERICKEAEEGNMNIQQSVPHMGKSFFQLLLELVHKKLYTCYYSHLSQVRHVKSPSHQDQIQNQELSF